QLYGGPLLAGYYEEWILPEQQRLAELYLQALRELVAHREEQGLLDQALDHARRAAGVDPLREETHRDLMRLYAATGQPSAALRQYRELERLLAEDLGSAPSPATRVLAQKLELQAAGSRGAEEQGGRGAGEQSGRTADEPADCSLSAPLLPCSPAPLPSLRVRMALHAGEIDLKDGEYHGLVLHRAARMLAAGHGGQILCSEAV